MAAHPTTVNNLTTLIKRLEAATSRLEDIATATEIPHAVPALATFPTPEPAPGSGPSSAPAPKLIDPVEEVPEFVSEFDAIIKDSVAKYIEASKLIGGLIEDQAHKVLAGLEEERKFLLVIARAKKPAPNDGVMATLLAPINEIIMDIHAAKDANRSSPLYHHMSAVAEGVMFLAWVTLENRPSKTINESLSSAQYWGNRVLKEYKDKDPVHVEWMQSFYRIFPQVDQYVKDHFPSGIVWNAAGLPATEVARSLMATPTPSPNQTPTPVPQGSFPPPPPPPPPPGPPPPPAFADPKTLQSQSSTGRARAGLDAVFSDLNKGEAVTKGLRKVDKSEMTHKNPTLRAGSTVPEGSKGPAPPDKKPKPESMRAKKPPKKLLEGNKWTIENYEKEAQPIEIQAELSHSILISKCSNTTIIIKGKANAVTAENTTRLSLIVDTLVSSVDVIKSQNFALQVLGTIPTVMMDQIDGAQIYLGKDSTATKVFASKSDGINLNVLATEDGDYKEVPLPSQICSYYDEQRGDLVNEIISLAG